MYELIRKLLFLPDPASTIATEIDWLHIVVIGVTMLGALGVTVFTLYFIVRYRERGETGEVPREEEAQPPVSRQLSVKLEVGVFTGLLAMFIAWWVIGFQQFVRIAQPPAESMTIYVTGKQWMWSFAYPNGSGSNGVLYVPAGRPVKLVMTSRDVIHSFYIPHFRLKRDVVPGQSTTLWFEVKEPGRYPAYCTEYCGTNHSTMRAEVIALADVDYERQLEGLERLPIATADMSLQTYEGVAGQRAPLSLAGMGQSVAARDGCLRCHTLDGTPHIGPTFAGLYGARIPLADGSSIIADEAYLTASMMDPIAMIHRGFKPVMPSYQGLLDAGEVGALVELIRSLRDVPRFDAGSPLPMTVPGEVPLVTPLPGRQAR